MRESARERERARERDRERESAHATGKATAYKPRKKHDKSIGDIHNVNSIQREQQELR